MFTQITRPESFWLQLQIASMEIIENKETSYRQNHDFSLTKTIFCRGRRFVINSLLAAWMKENARVFMLVEHSYRLGDFLPFHLCTFNTMSGWPISILLR